MPAILNLTSGVVYLTSINLTSSGTFTISGGSLIADSITMDSTNKDAILVRAAANAPAVQNGTTAQAFRVYGTTTGPKYVSLSHDGTNGILDTAASSGLLSLAPTNATAVNVFGILHSSATAPTVASGFGSGAAVAHNSGTHAFTVGVGTTTGTTGVITMPTAPNGWAAQCTNLSSQTTTVAYTKQTATSQTSITIGCFSDVAGAHAWADNDVISIIAFPY